MDAMDDEFAEFDLTEEEVDAMMEAGTPVEIVALPSLASPHGPYFIVPSPPLTFGSVTITAECPVVTMVRVSTGAAVAQTVSLAA